MEQVLNESIRNYCIAATCEKWSDDYINVSTYIFQPSFWVNAHHQLSNSMLRFKHFLKDSKTGMNIWQEIKSFVESFHLSFGDTPIVTDKGGDIKHYPRNSYPVYGPPIQHSLCSMLQNVVPSYYRMVNDIRLNSSYLKRQKRKPQNRLHFLVSAVISKFDGSRSPQGSSSSDDASPAKLPKGDPFSDFMKRLVSDQETLQAELDRQI